MANPKDPSYLASMRDNRSTDKDQPKRTVLVTGAGRGLGLAIARSLDAIEDIQLVLAVRDVAAAEVVTRTFRRAPRIVGLDLTSLDAVAHFTAAWREPLWGLVNNAGVQLTGPTSLTRDGFEETIAVNHLAATWLALGLLPSLRGGRAIAIGSATHDPTSWATRFGFRGGRFTSIDALARGDGDGDTDRQRGLDRYATSKLLAMTTMMELARRHSSTTFITLDPGLMPGTGLLRSGPWYARFAWRTVMRWLVPLVPGASTPKRSAAAARRLLTEDVRSGEVYDFRARPSTQVWAPAREPALAAAIVDQTIALLQPRWPISAVSSAKSATL